MVLHQGGAGRLAEQQLSRGNPGQFVLNLVGAEVSRKSLPRRYISPGQRKIGLAVSQHAERGQKIGGSGVEVVVFRQGAGCDQAHNFAFYHRFGAALFRFLGVFDLLADGHPMPESDQLVEVVIGGMDRHAAHRDFLILMLAALGQHNTQSRARDLGVLEEQLVEIAHAIEQQIARVDRLDLEILDHHRRQPRGGGRWRRCNWRVVHK